MIIEDGGRGLLRHYGGRHHGGGHHDTTILESFTTFAVSFTIITTTSFMVLKLCQKLHECCQNVFNKNKNSKQKRSTHGAPPAKYHPLHRVSKLPPVSGGVGGARGGRPFSPLHTSAEFQIPGKGTIIRFVVGRSKLMYP